MKKFITVSGLLVLLLAVCVLAFQIRANLKYDQARRRDFPAYAVTPMNQETAAFFAQVEKEWARFGDYTNGADSDVLHLAGKPSSVRNLIELFNYQMPKYRWFAASQNEEATRFFYLRAKFMPRSLDQTWHVSVDGHTAFLRCTSNVVARYQDEPAGLRATYYHVKKGGDEKPDKPSEPN